MLYDITYMWNIKNKTNECVQQNTNRLRDIENKLVFTSGEREGGRGFFTDHNTFKVHPCCSMYQYFIPFCGQIIFHFMDIYHILFIHSSVDDIWVGKNNAAISICLQGFVWTYIFMSLGYTPMSGIARSYGNSISQFISKTGDPSPERRDDVLKAGTERSKANTHPIPHLLIPSSRPLLPFFQWFHVARLVASGLATDCQCSASP